METQELIKALVADSRRPVRSISAVWWTAAGLAIVFTAILFHVVIGARTDIAAVIAEPRVLFKFVFATILTLSAFGCLRALSRPGEGWRSAAPYLAAPAAVLTIAVALELSALPPDLWSTNLVGKNSAACIASISLIGIGPLVVFLAALRRGAPTRPRLAGAMAGLLAGGIAAAFYAAHCTDDSPLFVATWYTLAVAGLALIGAVAADRFVRW